MTKPRHYVALDGLRGIAAVAVLILHRGYTMPHVFQVSHGYLAVDFFFMLSGFVVACAYEDKLRNAMSFADFMVVRIRRLYPLILLGGLLGAVVQIATSADTVARIAGATPFAMLALPAPPITSDQPFALNLPLWSLFFEIVANVLYALTIRHLTTRVLIVVTVVSGAVLVVAAQGHSFRDLGGLYPTLWIGIPRVIFSFTVGVLLYRARAAGRLPSFPIPPILVGAILFACFVPPLLGALDAVYVAAMIAIAFPAIIIAGTGTEVGGRMAWAAGWVGILSYPLYILHYPLYRAYDHIGAWLHIAPWLTVAVAGPIICVIALAAHVFYDAPVRNYLGARVARTIPKP